MAKKIQVKQILELRAAGLSQNNIAKSRHMSKSSVSDVFQIAQERSISYEGVKTMRPDGAVLKLSFGTALFVFLK